MGALEQLMMYTLPLESPPLLVVSDWLRIEVHSHFTDTPSECHSFALDDLAWSEVRQKLRAVWTAPESFKPNRTNRDITEEAARTFAGTADRMRAAGVPAEQVSHFLTQCLFCCFSEDVGLLPSRLFERGLDPSVRSQLGATYIDPATIARVVEPVIQRPLLAEWAAAGAGHHAGAVCGFSGAAA